MYQQVHLLASDGMRSLRTTALVCWVNLGDAPLLRVGQVLTLKETGDALWRVEHAYGTTQSSPRLTWRVGGLA